MKWLWVLLLAPSIALAGIGTVEHDQGRTWNERAAKTENIDVGYDVLMDDFFQTGEDGQIGIILRMILVSPLLKTLSFLLMILSTILHLVLVSWRLMSPLDRSVTSVALLLLIMLVLLRLQHPPPQLPLEAPRSQVM